MIGMVGVLVWSPAVPGYAIFSLFITIPLVLVNLAWVGYSLGILGARSPDVGQILNTILMVGFLFTPIIWEGSRYPPDSVGGIIVRLNPAFHILEIVREPLYGNMPGMHSILYVAIMSVVGWLFAIFLSRQYSRYVPIWI
jgi:ABC-type polysaccharide/polyol phosphate export permease